MENNPAVYQHVSLTKEQKVYEGNIQFPAHIAVYQANKVGETIESSFYRIYEDRYIAVIRRKDGAGAILHGPLWSLKESVNTQFIDSIVNKHMKITSEQFEEEFDNYGKSLNEFLNSVNITEIKEVQNEYIQEVDDFIPTNDDAPF